MDAVRGGPSSLSSAKVVAVAAGLSVGATLGYMLYRHSNRTNTDPDSEVSRMTLPVEVYRNISRHQNQFLDMVIQKSGAQVRLVSGCGGQEVVSVLLQGTKDQVLLARCTLDGLVTHCEPVSELLEVPQSSLGRIIGRGGESLKRITRTTGAKVSCPREKSRGPGATESVTIMGSRWEVQQAKELILDKVCEDAMVRTMISQSSALRLRRGQTVFKHKKDGLQTEALNNNGPLQPRETGVLQPRETGVLQPRETRGEPAGRFQDTEDLTICTSDQQEDEVEEQSRSTESLPETCKFEIPSPDLSFQPGDHLEVFVSAVENPGHFWIQILGVRSLQLDQLHEEMTRFYSSSAADQGMGALVVGDIVAAPYQVHGTWNRARVLGVLESGLVDLYYVDFGDNGELPRDVLRRMRSDFLSLPFQAIECSLAGVRPKGEAWTEDALDQFDQLTYCALWRPLQAKLCSYSHSDSSSWPSVELYDNTQGEALDIGHELIRRDLAISSQEGDGLGSLQRMLEDVLGASSELSLSCISLSEAASISGSADTVMEDELL